MLSTLEVRNVQEAYRKGLTMIKDVGVTEETRNGPALVMPNPVVTIYSHPMERVLLDPRRDANPFFHFMESFWMLAGARDVASIKVYNGRMGEYSDDGKVYHAAYGFRWRNHFALDGEGIPGAVDQVAEVIKALRNEPTSRRVVLQIWDPLSDLGRSGKDFPCNTQCIFRRIDSNLDMTLVNRSNDAIWGAYGSNAVHFSILQEYIAAMTGADVGRLYQWSNNLHAYEATLDKAASIDVEASMRYQSLGVTPLFQSWRDTEEALSEITKLWEGSQDLRPGSMTLIGYQTYQTYKLVWAAWKQYGAITALDILEHNECGPDWRVAAAEWLARRIK